jgi:hypothetical protein
MGRVFLLSAFLVGPVIAEPIFEDEPPIEPATPELEEGLEPESEQDLELRSEFEAAPTESVERPFDPAESLIDQLLEIHEPEHFANCATLGEILLNEICAAGTECDPDVRIRDFVELYNPGRQSVDLSCFVLTARDYVAFSPSGVLEPGGFRAFGEIEMGFRIAKTRDSVALYRLAIDSDGEPLLTESERVGLDEERVHLYRSPDGGSWQVFALAEAETGWPGSFGEPNGVPPETLNEGSAPEIDPSAESRLESPPSERP